MRKLLSQSPALRRYGVNVLVDHADRKGAPVVYEDLPTHANLVGRIEHHAHFGTLVTDFTLIRAGAFHRANGGFLVVDARKLLVQPFAWEELKRALRSREVRIEPPERLLGFAGTSTLEPDPIPLHAKVVLVGERLLYHLLLEYDPDFGQLFKIAADFADRIPRSDRDYARLIATLARRDRLRPLDRAAVTRVLDEAARRTGDAERLTAELEPVRDLLREADHRAAAAGRGRVGEEDVRAAVEARERRAGRVRELLLEETSAGRSWWRRPAMFKPAIIGIFILLISVMLFNGCGDKKDGKTDNGKVDSVAASLIKKDSVTGKDKVLLKYIVKPGEKMLYKINVKTARTAKGTATNDQEQKEENIMNYYYTKEFKDIDVN